MINSTVLFVDDQEEIRFLIKRMLKNEPYAMLFASSGKEALEIIGKTNVDVIVTDVLMPNMSGLELLDIIKKSNPNIVRIILSGFSQIPTLLSAINHGKIFRYITKPWQVDEEAKEVIRDAIEYSKLLKVNQDVNKDLISLKEFCEFLHKRGEIFGVMVDEDVTYVHEELKAEMPEDTPISLEQLSGLGDVDVVILSDHIKVYIRPKSADS